MPRIHKCTAKKLVNDILDRPLVWINWQAMPTQERKNWGAIAKAALENRALQSLIGDKNSSGEIVKRCIENIARRSSSQEETESMRHIICGIELVRELLEEMLVTEDRITVEDPNAAI